MKVYSPVQLMLFARDECYGLPFTSTDIDECASNDGGCDQVCTNTEGSFVCACDPGYQRNMNGTMCEGIKFPTYTIQCT